MNKRLLHIALITFFTSLSIQHVAHAQKIVYPWRATTAIVKAGDAFEIWFVSDSCQKVSSILLKGPYQIVKPIYTLENGNWIYDAISEKTFNTRIKVTVPDNAPADRYDIVLQTTTSESPIISYAGVKVIKDYKNSYYVMHFSDMHTFSKGSNHSLRRLSTIVDIANILNPELVFNTGDNLIRPDDNRMDQLFSGNPELSTKGLSGLIAATFSVVGNHDMEHEYQSQKGIYKEKAASWNYWWGLQAYNFKYGNGRFMVINNAWDSIVSNQHITGAKEWLQNEAPGNFRLVASHIKNKDLNELDSIANPNLILVGHHHHIGTQNPFYLRNRPTQYIASSVSEYTKFNLYKISNETGLFTPIGSSHGQIEYMDNTQDGSSEMKHLPKLSLLFLKENDGTSDCNTAILVNNFDFPIENARVRFIMPKGSKYAVTQGSIEQSFEGTSVQVVDVSVYLKPNCTIEMHIKRDFH
ncbi:MAG: hypothetical protein JXR65_10705 [Bacteroidales bacterium]|nr:hypothetical protein [Bacteroidales bacterium]